MGGYVQQNVYGKDSEAAAVQAADAVQALENTISWRIPGSELLEFNSRAGKTWLTLSDSLFSVLTTAQDVAENSNGAFDVTIAPVSRLWDFGSDRQEVPAAEDIAVMLQNVDYQVLRLNNDHSASLKNTGTAVDLSSISDGAACDAAVSAYRENEISAAIISVSDSVGVYGKKPDGTLWNIAVRDPLSSDALGSLYLDEGFLSTADISQNAFTENAVTYHSILDPKTGYPAKKGLLSVIVFSDSGTLSDALDNACFVLGQEDGMALLDRYGAEGVFISDDHVIFVTDGLKTRFTLTADNYTLSK